MLSINFGSSKKHYSYTPHCKQQMKSSLHTFSAKRYTGNFFAQRKKFFLDLYGSRL